MNASILKTMTIELDPATAETYQSPQLSVEYGIRVINDQPGYFTLTGELDNTSGAIHDEITEIEPFFALLSRLHLSHATTGEPMHAVANAWYFIEKGDHATAARLLRCSTVRVKSCTNLNDVRRLATDLAPQWRAEAELARLTYDLGPAAPVPTPTPGAFPITARRELVEIIVTEICNGSNDQGVLGDESTLAQEIAAAIDGQMSITDDIEEAVREFGTGDTYRLARAIVKHLTDKFQR